MPLYEYKCEKCGNRFEVMQKFADKPVKTHENCGGVLLTVSSRRRRYCSKAAAGTSTITPKRARTSPIAMLTDNRNRSRPRQSRRTPLQQPPSASTPSSDKK